MHPCLPLSQFIRHFHLAERNRSLMARIALNALGQSKQFPVDVSELRFLTHENLPIVLAFLAYAARSKPLPEPSGVWGHFEPDALRQPAWRNNGPGIGGNVRSE